MLGFCSGRLYHWPVRLPGDGGLRATRTRAGLFAALLAAMLETQMQRRSQWGLVALLAVAMALSHYSTTYVAVTVIGLALPLQLLQLLPPPCSSRKQCSGCRLRRGICWCIHLVCSGNCF